MINRTAGSGARGWALPVAGLALLLVALLLPAIPVRAASSIQIEARGLVGGRYAVGGWMGIAVTLVNDGEPTQGTLAAATESGSVQRFVEMPAGARKEVMLYLQPEAFQRQVTIQFQEPNGTVEAIVETRVLEQTSSQFAIVGDGPGTLRPQLSTGDGIGVPAPLTLTLADLPERPEPLEGLSAIVWADDSSGLSEAQRRSIERWVANGGQLVIVGGADWQARTAGFAEILPVDGLTAIDDVEQAAVASWAGAESHGRRVGHRVDRNAARRRAWPDPSRGWDDPGLDADGRCGPGHPRRYRSRNRGLPGLGRLSPALGATAADQCGAGAVLRRLPA